MNYSILLFFVLIVILTYFFFINIIINNLNNADYLDNLLVGKNKRKTAVIIITSLCVNIITTVSAAFGSYGLCHDSK